MNIRKLSAQNELLLSSGIMDAVIVPVASCGSALSPLSGFIQKIYPQVYRNAVKEILYGEGNHYTKTLIDHERSFMVYRVPIRYTRRNSDENNVKLALSEIIDMVRTAIEDGYTEIVVPVFKYNGRYVDAEIIEDALTSFKDHPEVIYLYYSNHFSQFKEGQYLTLNTALC